ncbi:hypothetical protein H4R24_000834 [Coemansia sp. RSA 988]|nr:hypothetical protein H4R24_000834 [Coemansia sp. RSA 988]
MKRLLHRSSKKGDDGQPSPDGQKRSWTGSVGLRSQAPPDSPTNHPRIRHVAMEGHVGPVTHATMDEIRRDAAASSSNLRINSLAPLPHLAASASMPAQPPPSTTTTDSPAYPPRTTSTAFAPLRIDTAAPVAASANDSDASAAGEFSAGASGGFDSPGHAAPRPRAPNAPDASRRVISEKIRNLANRFSNASLQDEPPTPPHVVRRRPSHSPSVSERVSLFDGHDTPPDPRSSDIFGRFGMASEAAHSRSSSAASTSICNAIAHSFSPAEPSDCDAPPPPADPLSTRAAGIQLSFNAPSSDSQRLSGYRGVRSDSPARYRRGSVRSTFGSTEASSLYVDTNHPTDVERNPADDALGRTTSATTSPTGTHASRPPSFRRPAAVVTSIADMQRSASAAGRGRASSYTPITSSPVPSTTSVDPAPPGDSRNLQVTTSDDGTLLDSLASRLGISGGSAIDSVLASAVAADRSVSPGSSRHGSFVSDRWHAGPEAAQIVEKVANTLTTGRVLRSQEYDRFQREETALRARFQELRVRLAADIQRRDAAKSAMDASKSGSLSMFKAKGAAHAQTDEYSAACNAVTRAEIEISELKAKQQLIESAIRDHQGAVLLAAVRTVVGEAVGARTASEAATAQLTDETQAARMAHAAELGSLRASHSATQQTLEEHIRDLQNKTHDALARQITRSSDASDPDSALTQHSAELALERMSGEMTVLREQRQEAEHRARALETRLDEALLRAQEARNALEQLQSQTSDEAAVSTARLAAAQAEVEPLHGCIDAFIEGMRSVVAPLRVLGDVRSCNEKLRALHIGSDALAGVGTPPATPTLNAPSTPPRETFTPDMLAVALAASNNTSEPWDATRVGAAMALVVSALGGCAELHTEALRLHEAHTLQQRDLDAERRLREAQGLAITQQREKLTRASYLAESAEQRVREATEQMAATYAAAEQAWAEERQRLLDNAERLARDQRDRSVVPNSELPPAVGSIECIAKEQPIGITQPFQRPCSAIQPASPPHLRRRWSFSTLPHSSSPASTAQPPFPPSTVMSHIATQTTFGESVDQMLAAYSEKLMLKEDALRSREDELDAVRAAAIEVEATLRTAATAMHARPLPRPLSPRAAASWSLASSATPALRSRSASLFQGLRPGSRPASSASDAPPCLPLRGPDSFHSSLLAVESEAATAACPVLPSRRSAVDGVPAFVRSLKPLVHMTVSETERLHGCIADLEVRALDAEAELQDFHQQISQLKNHCDQRAQQEDAVQQDIAHVLFQISRLRENVVRLEREKESCDKEIDMLRQRCRDAEDQSATQVLQLIVDRIGKRSFEKQRADSNVSSDIASASTQEFKMPARFAAVGSVAVSHPEAADIRAEFNALLHQVIARRDEDIERMQALVDVWRADAHKATHANEQRSWNSGSRSTQTT